jgi:predicted nucleic acid-binding protein
VTYLWDTTTFSALMRRDAKVRARVTALTTADRVVICTITRGEILYGLARLPEGKRRSALEAEAMSLFGQLVCLAVPEAAADQYASIKWGVSHLLHTRRPSQLKAFLDELGNVAGEVRDGLIELHVMLPGGGSPDAVMVFLQPSQPPHP